MTDIDSAMRTIDLYVDNHLERPDASMNKSLFLYCCERMNAVDILKAYLKEHWGEAPASDIVFHFVKERKRLKNRLKNDRFQKIVFELAKDILDEFL